MGYQNHKSQLLTTTEKQKWLPSLLPFELPHDETNKMTCASIEDSDQPGHMPSLIRFLAVHPVGSQGPKASSCGQQGMIRLGGCPSWSESLLGTLVILLLLSCSGSFLIYWPKVLTDQSGWSRFFRKPEILRKLKRTNLNSWLFIFQNN